MSSRANSHIDLVSEYVQLPANLQLLLDFDTCNINEVFILKNIAGQLFKSLLENSHLKSMKMDHDILARFIHNVSDKYHMRPFHNLQHAINVLHMTAVLVDRANLLDKLKPHIVFALYIAALCHDIDHPGHTNSYEINSFSKYARLYNDNSVLENHHCTTTFELLHEFGILHMFEGDSFKEFRKTIIMCILGTDMAKHSTFMEELSNLETCKTHNEKQYSVNEQYIICKVLLHSADLSSSSKRFDTCFEWSKRISQEFHQQCLKEEREGLNSLPFMKVCDVLSMSVNEINFMKNITIPLWELFVTKFDNVEFILNNCNANLELWKKFNASISENYIDPFNYL
jgi:hypothetical protein